MIFRLLSRCIHVAEVEALAHLNALRRGTITGCPEPICRMRGISGGTQWMCKPD